MEDCFGDLLDNELPPRRRGVDHRIDLTTDGPKPSPLILTKPEDQQFIKDYLDKQLRKGHIRPSKSPLGASLFLVPKKGGKRPVIDYRKLNEVTITDSTLLPLIDDTLNTIQGKTIFSKIDLKDAFNQIRIKEGDKWKTAFRTRYGTFEYLVMPFGLVNAPGTFQRYVNHVLEGKLDQGATAYMDDIFMISQNQREHRTLVRGILEQLRKAGLREKLSKSEFEREEIEILGYVINKHGVRPNPEHLAALKGWEEPTGKKEV
jgi:Reverse transcriptase (RNA-dependent DNA polymerase)